MADCPKCGSEQFEEGQPCPGCSAPTPMTEGPIANWPTGTVDPSGPAITSIASPLTIGDVVAGDYEIVREVGRGAFGVVFEARDIQMNSQVALKVLKVWEMPPGTEVDEARQRFLREARSLRDLEDHPSILRVYRFGDDQGRPFMALGWVDGGHAGQLMGADGVEPRRAAAILRQVASALTLVHAQGKIHRDIKPHNIMIRSGSDDTERAILSDFGIARVSDDLWKTSDGQVFGTPVYMAPEQIRGEAVAQSDIFSLGCTLFELITTKLPFRGDDPMQVIFQISQMDQPIDLEPMRAKNTPEALIEIVRRACGKSLADRYATAEAMEQDLAAFLEDQPTSEAASAAPTVAGPRQATIGEASTPATAAPTTSGRRGLPWQAVIGGAVVLALVGWLVITRPWQESPAGPTDRGAGTEATKQGGTQDAAQPPPVEPATASDAESERQGPDGPSGDGTDPAAGTSTPPGIASDGESSGIDADVDALMQSARQSFDRAQKMPVKSQRAPRLMWETLQDLQAATRLGAHRADAWYFLGQIEERLYSWPGQEGRTEGFRENALEHLQKACDLATVAADRTKHCEARDQLQRLISP